MKKFCALFLTLALLLSLFSFAVFATESDDSGSFFAKNTIVMSWKL